MISSVTAFVRQVVQSHGRAPNLPDLFLRSAARRQNVIHLAIDLQRHFVGPAMQGTAWHVARNIAPAFNRLGIPTWWVYYRDPSEENVPEHRRTMDHRQAQGGLIDDVTPAPHDRFIRKEENSAFAGSNIDDLLGNDGRRILLVSGFNFHFCVLETICDARENGYLTVLLRDGTNFGPGPWGLTAEKTARKITKRDGIIATSGDALAALEYVPE